jgi:hypothetical protein
MVSSKHSMQILICLDAQMHLMPNSSSDLQDSSTIMPPGSDERDLSVENYEKLLDAVRRESLDPQYFGNNIPSDNGLALAEPFSIIESSTRSISSTNRFQQEMESNRSIIDFSEFH